MEEWERATTTADPKEAAFRVGSPKPREPQLQGTALFAAPYMGNPPEHQRDIRL
jgi:hypothetical protein